MNTACFHCTCCWSCCDS